MNRILIRSVVCILAIGAFGGLALQSPAGLSVWQDPAATEAKQEPAEAAPDQDEPKQEPTETAPLAGDSKPADSVAPPAPEKSLDELLAEWKLTDQRLRELETAARASGADDVAKSAYVNAVDEANQLLDQLADAATKALQADGTNQTAAKTLIGIMANASRKNGNDGKVLRMADTLFAANVGPELLQSVRDSGRLTPFGRELFDEILIRQKEHAANDLPQVKLVTTKGDIILELFENQAPNTVANFISLAKSGRYNGVPFHRVVDGFMAQTGDVELKSGQGGPGYTIKCECYRDDARNHFTGSLSMAHAGKDTGGSQFFITFAATSHLDKKHTVFGRVLSGWDVLNELTRTHASGLGGETPIPGVEADKIVSVEVLRDRGHEYVPVKVGDAEPAGGKQ